MPDFAITTDYITSAGSALPYLESIVQAGWKWVHWCHDWNSDHVYSDPEIAEIDGALKRLGLHVLDIHGSAGKLKRWDRPWPFFRNAGVDLVRNRVQMAAQLGCDTVIMHPAILRGPAIYGEKIWSAFRRSVDALLPDCRRHSVRLAMENMPHDNFDQLEQLMQLYPPTEVGICYDPGHGNIAGNGLTRLAPLVHRLIALHLNDNDGHRDLHRLPFQGTVDWPTLAKLVRQSGYNRPAISVEVAMKHSGITDEHEFLTAAVTSANRFGQMLAAP